MLNQLRSYMAIIIHYMRIAYNIDKFYIIFLLISSVVRAFMPFINIIMSKYIIDEMLTYKRIDKLIFLVCITLIGNGILSYLDNLLTFSIDVKNKKIITGFELRLNEKIMNMEFEYLEDPEILNLKEKAIYPVKNQGTLQNMINNIVMSIQNIITVLSLTVLMSTLSLNILIFIFLFIIVNSYVSMEGQKTELQFINEIIKDNREMNYYRGLTQDFSMGKDIRLYNMKGLILSKIHDYIDRSTNTFQKLMSKKGTWKGVSNVILQLQMSAIYAYISYEVVMKNITVGSFSMYITASITFCRSMTSLLQNLMQFDHIVKFLNPYCEFENICSSMETTNGKELLFPTEEFVIEFISVYFKYPNCTDYALNNVNIKIASGEKLSIVGANGAGKTTFVKLLSRLYKPTKGEIRFNGVDINTLDFQQYNGYISTIFQDFKIFAFSIAENIAMSKYWDENKIWDSLAKVGLYEKVSKMEKSILTPIFASFDQMGIELSGGEFQKLAIARALYQDPKIIIMDEPTASLDPAAENEIFTNLNDLTKNKTTIFISHRLSSCKFCENIAVFCEGKIVQYGSHNDLIADKNGKYYTLFVTQARYYCE